MRVRFLPLLAACSLFAVALAACGASGPADDADTVGAPRRAASESGEARDHESQAERDGEAEAEEIADVAPPAPTQRSSGRVEVLGSVGDVRPLGNVHPKAKDRKPARELRLPALAPTGGSAADPVRQAPNAAPAAPAPAASTSFAGLDLASWGNGWPPDTTGDVGPSHYIQGVNSSVGIFDKVTGERVAAFTLNNFFTTAGATGVCANNNQGDPTVVYDSYSGRWIIGDFAFTSTSVGPFYECLAVSKTADPIAGGWWTYQFLASATDLNDFPKMSVWADGIYMTANMFRNGSTFTGSKVWALDRNALISGQPANFVSFQTSSSFSSLLVANARSTSVPAGTPAYVLSLGTSTSLRLWRLSVNFATPSASTFTGPTSIAVSSYRQAGSVNQPGGGERLDALSDRLMNRVEYGTKPVPSLWATHSVNSSNAAAIRWYQIDVSASTPRIAQQSTFQPDNTSRWMGSIAVDKVGNAAIGYSAGSSSVFPGIRYAGRLVTDPANSLAQTERTLVAGTGAQRGGFNRWGDYADMAIDPSNGCTFWFTTEYYVTTGSSWQTRIGSFKFPTCI